MVGLLYAMAFMVLLLAESYETINHYHYHCKVVFIMLACASKKLVHETQITYRRGIFCNIRFIISRKLSSVKRLCWTYTYDPIAGF